MDPSEKGLDYWKDYCSQKTYKLLNRGRDFASIGGYLEIKQSHILRGVLDESASFARAVLHVFDIDLDGFTTTLRGGGAENFLEGRLLPFEDAAVSALHSANKLRRAINHPYLDAAFITYGVLSAADQHVSQTMSDYGLTAASFLKSMCALLKLPVPEASEL